MCELLLGLLLLWPAVGLFRAIMWILYPSTARDLLRLQRVALVTLLAASLLLVALLLEIWLGAPQSVALSTFAAILLLTYLAGFLGWWIEEKAKCR